MMQIIFRPGPPMFVSGLGQIPGPIDRVIEGGVVYLVDSRRAGEVYDGLVCVTFEQAVAIAINGGTEPPAAAVPDAPAKVSGPAEAAKILGKSRDTVDKYLKRVDLESLPVEARPTRWGDNRQRTEWQSKEQVHAWWAAVTAKPAVPAGRKKPARASPTRSTAAPRKKPKRKRTQDLGAAIRELTKKD